MTENSNNIKAVSNSLVIDPYVGDPISKEIKLRETTYNPFVGYFGTNRWYNGIRGHDGYDYVAPIGSEVLAVGNGTIVQVRIGRGTVYKEYYNEETKETVKEELVCPFYKKTEDGKLEIENNFDDSICNECGKKYSTKKGKPIRGGCYGVQVWLKIKKEKKTYYAFYAHLSKLNEKVFEEIKSMTPNGNTYNLKIDVKDCEKQQFIIGESGCTGNASGETSPTQQHLHFECRDIKNNRISPNTIVKTPFYIIKKNSEGEGCKNIEIITKELIGITIEEPDLREQEWKDWTEGKNNEKLFETVFDKYWKKKNITEEQKKWNDQRGWTLNFEQALPFELKLSFELYLNKVKNTDRENMWKAYKQDESKFKDYWEDKETKKKIYDKLYKNWCKLYTNKFCKQYKIISGGDKSEQVVE